MCFSRCNSLNLTGLMLTKGDIKISCLIWLIVSYDASCEGYLDTVMIINAKLSRARRVARPRVTKLTGKNCQVRG